MKKEKLIVKNLCKEFQGQSIVNNISFAVDDGEFVAIMGQSGCGKSTLLYSVSSMDKPTSGEVWFDGQELSNIPMRQMEQIRLSEMGFIFQKPNFLKNLSIFDNIIFPAFQLARQKRSEIVANANRLMERLGINHIKNHEIHQVSGGQLQRAAICRAMINQPSILFGDEPTGALNSAVTLEVLDILIGINRSGTAILLVTHDAKVAAAADRVIYMQDGQIRNTCFLGKYMDADKAFREKKIRAWLETMGF